MRKATRLLALLTLVCFLQAVVAAPLLAQEAEGGSSGGASEGGSGGSSGGAGEGGDAAAGDGDENVKEKVEDAFGSVVEAGKQVYESIKNTVKDTLGSLFGGDGAATGGAGDAAGGDAAGGEGAEGASLESVIGKLNEVGLTDMANQIQSGVDNVENFVKGGGESAQDFVDMVKEVGDKMGQPIDLYGDAQKLGEKNPILKDVERFSTTFETDGAKVADSVKSALTGSGDGAPGMFAQGGSLAEGYKGDAAQSMAGKLDQLSGLRSDPAKFEQKYGEMFNAKAEGGGFTATSQGTLAGVKLFGEADFRGQAGNEISQNQMLLKGEAWAGPRVDSSVTGSYLNGAGQFSATNTTGLGLMGQGEGNVKWMTGDSVVDAKGKVNVVAGAYSTTTVKNTVNLGGGFGSSQTAVIDAMAGAQARANGTLYAGKNGLEASGGAEARVGAWVDAKGSASTQYKGQNLFTAEGSAGAGLGVGAGIKGGAAFRADKVGVSAQVTLGPVKLGGGVYVNPVAMGEMAVDKGKQAVAAVGAGAKYVGTGIKNGAVATGTAIKNGASAIGTGAKNLWNRFF